MHEIHSILRHILLKSGKCGVELIETCKYKARCIACCMEPNEIALFDRRFKESSAFRNSYISIASNYLLKMVLAVRMSPPHPFSLI